MLSHLALSVNVNFEVTDRLYIHHIFPCLFRCEYGFILGREILQVHAWSEIVHTCCGDSQRSGVELCGYRLSTHLCVVPERAFQTLLAVHRAIRVHQAIHHLVVSAVTSWQIEQ